MDDLVQADALVSQQDRIARLRAEGNLKLKEANLQENPRGKMAVSKQILYIAPNIQQLDA